MPVGHPPKFKSVEDLQSKIDAYFAATPTEKQTITGLALALDTTRETLCDYQNKDEFSYTVKKAKLQIEHAYELSLRARGSAGDIFGLKNFGWRDRQEMDHTTNGNDLPTPILGGMSVRRDDSDTETTET